MPGMLETILDLGLNDEVVEGFAVKVGSARAAYDSYRRFVQMYANVVDEVDNNLFESVLSSLRTSEGVSVDSELSTAALQSAVHKFKQIYAQQTTRQFPSLPLQQLEKAVLAVFKSWDCARATAYRRFHGFTDSWGTAVVVMLMVFGNRGDDSASGVGFTRDPSTGEANFYGEFLPNSQGEDVVSGVRTPLPVNKFQANLQGTQVKSLQATMPEIYEQLIECGKTLEKYFHDMQDVEFTIEHGKLYMLQTRTGKRTGFAALRIACEMLAEGLVDEKTALLHVEPEHLSHVLSPVFCISDKTRASQHLVARGLNAGPGAAAGHAAFSSNAAVRMRERGVRCVLVREETSPEDFAGMVASEGILTLRGGATSHAAVVARGMGRPCVCGCTSLHFHEGEKPYVQVNGRRLYEGDAVSLDGTTGQVFFCELPTKPSEIYQALVYNNSTALASPLYRDYARVVALSTKHKRLAVYTNVDTPADAQMAKAFGAEGVGLCRTEHMFMDKNRLEDVRVMLFSENDKDKEEVVKRLLPLHKQDFVGIFKAMDGCDVTIRLLDPPRHEFLPHSPSELSALGVRLGIEGDMGELSEHIREVNPMMGHRGCRLGITDTYLTTMQTRAILEAAVEATSAGVDVRVHIMVPLVMCVRELQHQKALIDQTAKEVAEATNVKIQYKVGTMIELPRACLRAGELAEEAAFFSFGTNDLTQCTFGISRDDAGSFLPAYIRGVEFPSTNTKIQILETDPFSTLDEGGVCELMSLAISRGVAANPNLQLGLCGEHGGDGRSVRTCHDMHMHYVSCSPFRIAVAKLAAAQANIVEMRGTTAGG
eukprot:GHVS01041672.1.p1 GENE.GHVS01041672.1~~GHVS01041672.1.p1  ORF type:complete len:822 (-),score=147.96 GHVS01041672.1:104-2569(-)